MAKKKKLVMSKPPCSASLHAALPSISFSLQPCDALKLGVDDKGKLDNYINIFSSPNEK